MLENGSKVKLRDEKKYCRDIFDENERENNKWRNKLGKGWKYKRNLNLI